MTTPQIIVFVILAATLVLFIWGRFRHDIVALLSLLAVVLTGLIDPKEAFDGFSNDAVITVAAVLVIGRVMMASGAVDLVGRWIEPFTKREWTHIAALVGVVTLCSAFMNNVGALAIVMPLAIQTARARKRPPSLLLMPLAFGSLLGGMTTLIGTPPNIIASDIAQRLGGEAFSMFDFTPVALPIAAAGIVFMALFARLLLPTDRKGGGAGETLFKVGEYISELRVAAGSALVDKPLRNLPGLEDSSVLVVGVQRGDRALATGRYLVLREGDILIVEADAQQLQSLAKEAGLELVKGDRPHRVEDYEWADVIHMEAVVAPGSVLEGRRMSQMRYYLGRVGVVIGVARQGQPIRSRLREVQFRVGDVLLIQGDASLTDTIAEIGLLPLAEREVVIDFRRKIGVTVGIFALAIAATVFNVTTAAIAFTAAVVVYVVAGLLPVRDLYRSIDWSIIVLLGALFPVGAALESTGGSELIASTLVSVTEGLPAWTILALVLFVTMALTPILNNAATVIIMAPLAFGIAQQLGVSSSAFIMAVAVGASVDFLTPIGHQSNTLVLGPGGYKFGDYWRLGLPLEILVLVMAVPLLLFFWPLSAGN